MTANRKPKNELVNIFSTENMNNLTLKYNLDDPAALSAHIRIEGLSEAVNHEPTVEEKKIEFSITTKFLEL